jgi:galactonate dehydratase
MRIRKIEAWPIRLSRDMTAATGTAGSPTKLAGSGDYRWSAVFPCLYSTNFETALIRVTLENGLYGWGEAQAPLAPEVSCEIVRLLLTPALVDADFDGSRSSIEALWDRMYSAMRVRGQTGGFMLDAISGVDLALWDLAGKIAQAPVYALLGGSRVSMPAYVSGLPANGRNEAALRYRSQGFRKFKLFFDTPAEADFLRSMDAMPDGAQVAVDALWRFDLSAACTFGAELDARGALWFEAPMPPEDPIAHGQLAAAIHTPVAIGESYRTRYEIASFVRERAVEVLQPDLGRCGITEGLRMAQAAGAPVVPHVSIAMGPQVAAALHFASALSQCTLVEYNPQVLEVANRFLRAPIAIEGDSYRVPSEPGLGVELNEDLLV